MQKSLTQCPTEYALMMPVDTAGCPPSCGAFTITSTMGAYIHSTNAVYGNRTTLH